MFFNGSTDQYVIGDTTAADITGTTITIHALIRPTTSGAYGKFASKWNDGGSQWQYILYRDNVSKLVIGCGSGLDSATSTANVAQDTWTYVGGRKNGNAANGLTVWLNGVQDGINPGATTSLIDTTAPLKFGAGGSTTVLEHPFAGYVEDVAIWDIALSDAEMLSLGTGTAPSSVQAGNLKIYYPLRQVYVPRQTHPPAKFGPF